MATPLSPMANILKLFAPATPVTSADYEGLEYRWNSLVFRPALFKTEAFVLLALLGYIIWYFVGKSVNTKKVNTWLEAHFPILEQQFARPGGSDLVLSDGPTDFFNLSTGRRSVETLHTVFTLNPRHDLLQTLYHIGWGFAQLDYEPTDEVYLDFLLPSTTSSVGFVWALVNKEELRDIKKSRWDLTFTRTSELAQFPASFVVMSEFADVTESLLKQPSFVSFLKLLKDSTVAPFVRSLSITDQQRERPNDGLGEKERHVILSLTLPPAAKAAVTVKLVQAIFGIVDDIDKLSLRPETRTKLKRARDDLEKELQAEADREQKEKAQEDKESKKAAKRKAEEERLAKLSAADQQKATERERKRNLRKQMAGRVKKV